MVPFVGALCPDTHQPRATTILCIPMATHSPFPPPRKRQTPTTSAPQCKRSRSKNEHGNRAKYPAINLLAEYPPYPPAHERQILACPPPWQTQAASNMKLQLRGLQCTLLYEQIGSDYLLLRPDGLCRLMPVLHRNRFGIPG